jgi:hypothetical protein
VTLDELIRLAEALTEGVTIQSLRTGPFPGPDFPDDAYTLLVRFVGGERPKEWETNPTSARIETFPLVQPTTDPASVVRLAPAEPADDDENFDWAAERERLLATGQGRKSADERAAELPPLDPEELAKNWDPGPRHEGHKNEPRRSHKPLELGGQFDGVTLP